MRLIKINAPEGTGARIIEIAYQAGITEVTLGSIDVYCKDREKKKQEVLEMACSTPQAKLFSDLLMSSEFFNREEFTLAIREPRSLLKSGKIRKITAPRVIPDTELYEELWQFSQITVSFAGRVFVAAALISYGLIKVDLIPMAAGLMLMPYLHQVLSVSFGFATREWTLARQGVKALLTATLLIIISAAMVALLLDAPVAFDGFKTTSTGFIIAALIGVAAVFGITDDAGRREMVGLAITSQTAIYPAWFGVSLVVGFGEGSKTMSYTQSYLINLFTMLVVSGITYRLSGMGKNSLMDFIRRGFGR